MQMFRVLEFLRIRDSKNTLLWKQVSSFSHRNYFQCVTLFLSAALQCHHLQREKRRWKLKQWGKCVSEYMSKMRSYYMCVFKCVTKWELGNAVMQNVHNKKLYRSVATESTLWSCLHMYTQQCACIPFLCLSACFCKCYLYTWLLVKIWLHWTVNIWIWHPVCDSFYME